MNWIRVPALAGGFALALSASVVWAQADTSASGASASASSSTTRNGGASDKVFVKKAMEGGMAEVKLGQLAAQKGNSSDVKQFGQKMVDDHRKMNDDMKPIASNLGVTEPSEVSAQDKALETKLQGLSGDEFDKAYMSAMVKDHRKDLTEFKREASTGKDRQMKTAAAQGAQVIQQHLELAEQVAQKVGANTSKPSPSHKAKPSA